MNIFANVGILGGVSFVIFMFLILKTLIKSNQLVSKAVASAIIGYEVSILFGFSTVATQLFMFLEIAIVLILTKQKDEKNLKLNFLKKPTQIFSLGLIFVVGVYALFFVFRMYLSDISTTKAAGSSTDSLLLYSNAIALFPAPNPFYLSDASYVFAQAATTSENPEFVNSLKIQSEKFAQESQKLSPKNVITIRKLGSTYIVLSSIDKNYYTDATSIGNTIVTLAPTDPQSYLSQAKTQVATQQNDDAIKSLQTALQLKPDYVEAQQLLSQLTTKR